MTGQTNSSWIDGAAGPGFDADHLPYGIFRHEDEAPRVGVRIGGFVLDLAPLAAAEMLDEHHVFEAPSLNPLLAQGPAVWAAVRRWVTGLVTDTAHQSAVEPFLLPLADVELLLPIEVADYVDFYASEHHATNVGTMFRPDGDALTPNWKHLPIGYHGRAGTVVVGGTDVVRPSGQRVSPDTGPLPVFGPSRRLDLEAELGYVVGVPSRLGSPAGPFAEHVFGVTLLNDWSARDIQAWEYVPLGPFLGKSFATSISPWVTPLAALAPAEVPLPAQDPEPLPYLADATGHGYDIELEVVLNDEVVARPPYSSMYWSPAQMLAHLTVNGASVRTGDLYASGTVSGPEKDQRGSFLELSWGGKEPFTSGGRERAFLEDGDVVTLRATAPGALGRITFGEVTGRVLPAI
jgi:fumarylacetoacetase